MNFMIRDIDEDLWDKFRIVTIMEKPKISLNTNVKRLIEEEIKLKLRKSSGRRE